MRAVAVRERKTVWDRVDALHAQNAMNVNEPGFTAQEYAERYQMTSANAHVRLKKLMKKGLLKSGWAIRNGRRVCVYQFPEA